MFQFSSPLFLILLAILPLKIWYQKRHAQRPLIRISSTGGLQTIPRSRFLKTAWIIPAVKYTAFFLMVLAMARPQWGTRQVEVLTEGINIVLAVDVSGSMAALDFKRDGRIVNRLEAVKGVIEEFIAKRDGDRIGVVIFGSEAFTQIPLTRDYHTIAYVMDRIEIGAAGTDTAIGDAIGISLKRLKDIDSKSNIIILLTDGQSNAGELSPETATQIAKTAGVKIYTIGVGTKGKAPFRIEHPLLGEQFVYQNVNIDEAALERIAKACDGMYFKADNTPQLAKIYDMIDRMEKTTVKVKTFAEYRELYRYCLIPAFVLLLVWIVLTHTRYLRVP
jgi:Ca-activated chloride channel family protein